MSFRLRKRVILTALLTIGVLLATNNIWLIRRPIRTELDITNAKDAKVEVQLNRKNNNDFIKIHHASIKVSSDTEHLIINNRTSKTARKFRLKISELEKGKVISIKNINLHFNKCKLNELDKFIIKGANFETKDNTLVITPNNETITLLYDKPINEKAPKRFEFELFTIILIISSLLGYKLLDYAADFSLIKHKSRIDIVFLCIFFVMLFIPMSHINQAEKSKTENRMLAKWKPLINQDGSINCEFGKNYETWFNDRFSLRGLFIGASKEIRPYSANNPKGIIDKKTKSLYGNYEFRKIPEKEINKAFEELIKLEQFLSKNNIKLYVLIVPNKVYIYPSNIQKYSTDYYEEVIAQKEKSNLNIIYPLKELKDVSKTDYVFFKTDHHWTDPGAYVGYKEAMKLIQKDFSNVNISEIEDYSVHFNSKVRAEDDRLFTSGCSCKYLNLPLGFCNKFLTNNYKYFTHKDFSNLKTKTVNTSKNWSKDFYYSSQKNNLKVLMMGTSMMENLSEFIPYSFKHTRKMRLNGTLDIKPGEDFKIMKYYKQQILDYKPDIFILCITVYNLHEIPNLFKE